MKDKSGLDMSDGEKCLDSVFVLKGETAEFADGLDVGKRERYRKGGRITVNFFFFFLKMP